MRKYGQHFLKDEKLGKKFIELLKLKPGQSVVEIGPGTGALTKLLIEEGCRVLAFEIDEELAEKLQSSLKSELLEVRVKDFLRVEKEEINGINLCVGSIPYQNSLEIVLKICLLGFEKAALIVQKEFAQKLMALPGDRRYTFVSALVQSIYAVKVVFDIPRWAFSPPPKVTSSALIMEKIRQIQDLPRYIRFLRQLFTTPNKLLKNSVEIFDLDEKFLNKRVRQLSSEELIYLYGKWLNVETGSFGNGT
ncbi:16S rRNA (adenine(1518)-N(6)/adenine(1519)-N(6))-dimethyltransferase RsmA [Pseudothermotoga thermarum]|uniref:Ribosomal RNA adenine methylase transferase n=1 Tax=Pseudothermotoga thermarum DSM 5069 TaxID=688269 RepID=F7YUB5_9THEM|nr:16S rRNA (adenine(1518)-N(6)/adenine(1519)-N(6))-dimethyltransferase RsmA [Pseudothermotoga thermarum]AEH51314.1 ribosomal RNA adenine methylase transferase [Pseudothermotoga thermarum DSM 5069]